MKKLEKDELLLRVSEFYKSMSDFTRFKIIYVLLSGERCVSDIEKEISMSQTAVSYQLKILRQAHLVKYRREGQNVFYSIDDDHVKNIVNLTIDHVKE